MNKIHWQHLSSPYLALVSIMLNILDKTIHTGIISVGGIKLVLSASKYLKIK